MKFVRIYCAKKSVQDRALEDQRGESWRHWDHAPRIGSAYAYLEDSRWRCLHCGARVTVIH